MKWYVKNYNCNANIIEDYDVIRCREDEIKKLKKKCATKEEFSEALKREMMWMYWSRCEYELIISISENRHIILSPWVGCRNPEEVAIDVTDDKCFDWKGFAEKHINSQIFKNEAKIDVWDQIEHRYSEFVDYCWHTRFKYERDNPKFHE